MNSELAQAVVLITFGNAALDDDRFDAKASLRSHVLLESNRASRSLRFGDRAALEPVPAVLDWYAALKREGASRLWLVEPPVDTSLPEHLAKAFAEAGGLGIQVDLAGKRRLLLPQWTCHRSGDWRVHFRPRPLTRSLASGLPDVASATGRLQTALDRAQEFAQRVDEDGWATLFETAATRPSRIARQPKYLPPVGYSRAARRLMSIAAAAWVFGGMGSWSDLGFQSRRRQDQYERVTESLYRAVFQGVLTAANAYTANA